MVGQPRRLDQPAGWGRRERRWWFGAAGVAVLAIVALIAFAAQSGGSAAPGCIQATGASYTGGVVLHACGADARALCRQAVTAEGSLVQACRGAGFAVGPVRRH